VVFTDGGRGLVQEVAPGIADTGVDGLNSPFGLLPVLAEFDFAAHSSLAALYISALKDGVFRARWIK